MLIARVPDGLLPERTYAIRVLIESFLGLEVSIEVWSGAGISLQLQGAPGQVHVADAFFVEHKNKWLKNAIFDLHTEPFHCHDSGIGAERTKNPVPVIFGRPVAPGRWVRFEGNNCWLGLDVFGSAFFMLLRYEEVVSEARDQFGCFPESLTIAARCRFLDRPIINEYLEILWACMQRVWPGIIRRARRYRVLVSHDVDLPFAIDGVPAARILNSLSGDLIRRKDIALFSRRLLGWFSSGSRRLQLDPYYSFDFLTKVSSDCGLRDAYYFIPTQRDTTGRDGFYDFNSPLIASLIRALSEKGHEIGLHASFYSAARDTVKAEFMRLKEVCSRVGVSQEHWGGRHHFLRIEPSKTFRQWDEAGLSYDSSLGYWSIAGFRAGTCYEYPTFDLLRSEPLHLIERPLIVMDHSVGYNADMGRKVDSACDRAIELANTCRRFGGDFTLLWHNSYLQQDWEKDAYRKIVAAAAS